MTRYIIRGSCSVPLLFFFGVALREMSDNVFASSRCVLQLMFHMEALSSCARVRWPTETLVTSSGPCFRGHRGRAPLQAQAQGGGWGLAGGPRLSPEEGGGVRGSHALLLGVLRSGASGPRFSEFDCRFYGDSLHLGQIHPIMAV